MTKLTVVPVEDRAIRARKATPGLGILDPETPLRELADLVPDMRRVVVAFWSRLHDEEQTQAGMRRARRMFEEQIPNARQYDFDAPLEPIDLVMMVAGMIFPGIRRWRTERPSDEALLDVWWGTWGLRPGAAIVRDGVLHLIGMDGDLNLASNPWMKWAGRNWRGPILLHGIQPIGAEEGAQSQLLRHQAQQAKSGQAGCILWTSNTTAIRPWRADLAGGDALIRPIAPPLVVAGLPPKSLSLAKAFDACNRGFWSWLRALETPGFQGGRVPQMQVAIVDAMETQTRVKAVKAPAPQGAVPVPLLEEVVSSPVGRTPAEEQFGERPTTGTPKPRLEAMRTTAKRSLLAARTASNSRLEAVWIAVLEEIEAVDPESCAASLG